MRWRTLLISFFAGSLFVCDSNPSANDLCFALSDGSKWCWMRPQPQGASINAMWFVAHDRGWAVGDFGTMLEWNGTKWQYAFPPGGASLISLWALDPEHVYIGSDTGHASMWNGSSLAPVQDLQSAVTSISGTSANDIWLAGPGDMLHFDGASWSRPTGGLPSGQKGFDRVFSFGPGRAVGSGCGYVENDGCKGKWLFARWENGAWLQAGSTPTAPPDGGVGSRFSVPAMWGATPDDVWAFGNETPSFSPTCWHSDGGDFVSCYGERRSGYHWAWGFGPADIYAAGDGIEHLPDYKWIADFGVNTIHGASADDLWAGSSGGKMYRSVGDNAKWTALDDFKGAFSIAAVSSDDVWVGGETLSRWHDGKWSEYVVCPPRTNATSCTFDSIAVRSADDIWASGESYPGTGGHIGGAFFHWTGTAWQDLSSSTDYPVQNLAVMDSGDVWGLVGVPIVFSIGRFDGTRWNLETLPEMRDVFDLVGGSGWLFALTMANSTIRDARIRKRDPQGVWSELAIESTTAFPESIWASGPNDIFVLMAQDKTSSTDPDKYTLRHFDGAAWSSIDLGALASPVEIFGAQPNQVWLSSEWSSAMLVDSKAGVVVRHDFPFTGYAPFRGGLQLIRAATALPSGELWLAGDAIIRGR